MNLAKQVAKVKVEISRGLTTQHPIKILGGLVALGGLLSTGIALQFTPSYPSEADNPTAISGVEEFGGLTEDTWWGDPVGAAAGGKSVLELDVDQADPAVLMEIEEIFGEGAVADIRRAQQR